MALFLQMPNLPAPDQRWKVTIENNDYFIRVYYQPRTRSFYMNLDDTDEQPIHRGVRMVVGFPLLKATRDIRKALSGDFFAVSDDGQDEQDEDAYVDGRLRLFYADAEQIAELAPPVINTNTLSVTVP